MSWLRREYLLLVGVTFLWGSGHTAGKIALRELESGQLVLLRPGIAWLVLVILVVASGRAGQAFAELRRAPRLLMVLGLLGYAGAGGSTVLALSVLPAGITSLLTSTSPLMLVLGQVVLTRRRVDPLQALGALLGFLGVVILSSGGLATLGQLQAASLLGVPLALSSAVCWAGYTALVGRLGRTDALVTTALTSGIGTAAVGLVAVPSQHWTGLVDASPRTWLATLWAGGMAIGCAYVVWSLVLRRLPPATALPFNYLTPLFSLGVAALILGEAITLPVALGAACVLAGVALSQVPDLRRLLRARAARPGAATSRAA